MGILTFKLLLSPLQSLVDFFSPPVASQAQTSYRNLNAPKPPNACVKQVLRSDQAYAALQSAPIHSPLSIQTPCPTALRSRHSKDGRYAISGKLRDVCAELDRLCAANPQTA